MMAGVGVGTGVGIGVGAGVGVGVPLDPEGVNTTLVRVALLSPGLAMKPISAD